VIRELRDRDDIEELVRAFYDEVFVDPLIGPIFTDIARVDVARHLPIMFDFWETVLLGTGTYRRNALQVHLVLSSRTPLRPEHFERWLELWEGAVATRFDGEKAERAVLQARRIAGSIQRRIAGRSGSEFETIGYRDTGAGASAASGDAG